MSLGWIAEELARLEEAGLRRRPVSLSSAPGPEVEIDGRRVVLLCSNNYLGLADDPRVRRAAADAALRWGAGAGASRLVSGTTDLHRELEIAIAAHKGTEDCVLFSSGYLANVGTIAALVGREDLVCSDELNHASIIDGCRVSGAAKAVYEHADASALDRVLAASTARRRLVVTDTVFSMDGDLAPLREIVEVCERHDATLMVDEAHATGVLGPDGAGAVALDGLTARVPVIMGTLSKALGSAGGFVAGSASLVEWLRNRARTHVYDTGSSPASVGAALEALRIVGEEPERRARALAIARALAGGIRGLFYEAPEPAAAVVPVIVGDSREAMELSRKLLDAGVFCPAIRPPTVPEGTARLRVTAMATHTEEHVERALDAFASARGAARRKPSPVGPFVIGPDTRPPRARGIFVTGTDTGVGKTVVTALVARALCLDGQIVGILKPAETGIDWGGDVHRGARLDPHSAVRGDAFFAMRVAKAAGASTCYTLREPLAPSVAARLEDVRISPFLVDESYRGMAREADAVLVEGAGGLLVPLTDSMTMADLASRLALPVVVVARPGLGTINHTVLTVHAAQRAGLEVLGVVLSDFPDTPGLAESTNPAEIERLARAEIIGVIPHIDGLDVDAGTCPPDLDPRPWLAPVLGGTFDRTSFLVSLQERRPDVART